MSLSEGSCDNTSIEDSSGDNYSDPGEHDTNQNAGTSNVGNVWKTSTHSHGVGNSKQQRIKKRERKERGQLRKMAEMQTSGDKGKDQTSQTSDNVNQPDLKQNNESQNVNI